MVQVLLWDERLHPTRYMSQLQGPQNLEGFVSVRMTDDGRAVIAGTVCGQVTHRALARLLVHRRQDELFQ